MQIGITDKLGSLVQFTALIMGSIIVAFVYSWQLTLATSSALVACLLIVSVTLGPFLELHKLFEESNGKATTVASETISSIRMVHACGAESRVATRHNNFVQQAKKFGLRESKVFGFQLGPMFFCMFGSNALAFWFGTKLYLDGHVDNVGAILIVIMSVLLMIMSLGSIISPLNSASKAGVAAGQFFEKIDMPVMSKEGLKEPDVSVEEDITFEDVTFAYPTRPHIKVLDGLSVTLQKGKLTAIVGPSGSGKSTVVGLIERWYGLSQEPAAFKSVKKEPKDENEKTAEENEPKEKVKLSGIIRIGNTDLKDLDLKWWRSQIGLVQQEPFIFNLSIYENVSYGLVGTRWEAEDEDTKRKLVKDACRESYADEFTSRLPKGYDTLVGDSGMKLSGGQRQRLAIARAIVKRPNILIFDEATSSIDVRGERIVQAALDRVAKHRTTITIAHRLSTIKKADNILVVANGKLVEQGTHDELVGINDGVYHNLVNAQQIMMGDTKEWEVAAEETVSDPEPEKDLEKSQESAVEETKYQKRGLLRSFGRLIIEQNRYRHWMFLTVLGSLGGGLAVPVLSYILGNTINVFSDNPFPKSNRDDYEGMKKDSAFWALALTYACIGVGVSYTLMAYASNNLSVHVASTYRQQYFEGVVHKPISFFDLEENSAGSLIARLGSDPTQLQELMGSNMGMMYIAMISVIACAILALVLGWKLALVALCSALPITLTAGYYRVRFEIVFEKMMAKVFAESSQFASEALGAVRTVTSMTLEDMIVARYERLLYNHVRASERKSRYTALVFALSDSVGMLCMALTFWYGGKLIAAQEYSLKQWFIIYNAIIQGSEAAGMWMSYGPNMAQTRAAANRILSLREGGEKSKGREVQAEGGVEIELRNVNYSYAGRNQPVFSDLNIKIEKGQFAALVGPSGCGKSTIISLLEQFYKIDSGSLTLDGQNVYDIEFSSYRRLFSLVAQEATLFQGTLRENILLGVPEDSPAASDESTEAACRSAEIWDFIQSLPEGLNTDIGSKGVALSGGQKQRLSIARALIRSPVCILLDEATSSLDSESERLIQQAFKKAGKGRTMVVVAHRLATIQNADVILVLGGGGDGKGAKVLEKGTHRELVEKRGVYYQMCQSQALDR